MRASLPRREPEQIRRWREIDLYGKLQEVRKDAPLFVLHDGPPYANGNIHLGHSLNKILKDFIVKFRAMAGWRAPYVPGWDCHGLPIELQVERSLGRKGGIPKSEFRQLCREYAEKYVGIQREEFRRLGVLGDWERPYRTMDPAYVAEEIRQLGIFLETGAVYRGRKPVLWCPSCRTALAEAEVEYEEHTSPSIYVAFALKPPYPAVLERFREMPIDLVIWTTTPWTLPANLAIAVHPDLEYVLVESGTHRWIVAKGLLEPFLHAVGASNHRILHQFPGRELERAVARHPWIDRDSLLILAPHVTLEAGTGCVHTAPGHGQEDYEVGLRYGLEIYAPVDAQGRFTAEVEGFAQEMVFDADSAIVARLRESGRLLKAESLAHSYPHCWRCKNPVIFRATDQWFVSMEKNDLRARTLEAIDRIRWIPGWGRERIRGMMEHRPDWCISRQRNWGVPIVAFYCHPCGAILANRQIADRVAGFFEREGSDAWFIHSPGEFLPKGTRCVSCGSEDFRKEEDILDVWFDSGVSHVAVLEKRPDLGRPADVYLEGSDQHRGWFHSSLLTSMVTRGAAPYRAVLTHGFTLDVSGRKMSKSLGTGLSPQDITERHGAEILRLWVAAEDYRDDVRISEEILGRLVESYRRIRNTARFLIANLYDFSPGVHAVEASTLLEIDRWILDRTARLAARCRSAYLDYEFHLVYHSLNNFCSVDLSALYLDIVKDRLYCSRADGVERRAAQTTLWRVLDVLTRLMTPILSFTAEEVWAFVPSDGERPPSPLLCDFPDPGADSFDDGLAALWERVLQVRSAVTKALEEPRRSGVIGHSLDARVLLGFDDGGDLGRILRPRLAELPTLFIVSQVETSDDLPPDAESALVPGLKIAIERARGEKCARCWNYSTEVGTDPAHPALCARCASVLS